MGYEKHTAEEAVEVKFPTILTKRLQPITPAHTVANSLCRGFCMLERLSLFCLGGGAYAALELAWRGTTHWTMFLAGGSASAFAGTGRRPLPLAVAAALGAAGVSGLELAVGAVCRRLCISPSGIMPMSGATWRAWSARATPFTGFALRVGRFRATGALKVPFIALKNRYRRVKVQIIVLSIWYNKDIPDKKGGTYHDPAVQIRRRPH